MKFGKKTMGFTMAAAAGLGAGKAIADSNPLDNARDFALEAVLDDPDADKVILGRKAEFSELFPWASLPKIPSPVRYPDEFSPLKWYQGIKMLRESKTLGEDAFRRSKDPTARLATKHVEDQATSTDFSPFSTFPYQPDTRRRGVAADGDMVFGMHNTRFG